MVRCYSVSPGKPTIIKLIPSITSLFSQSLARSPPWGGTKFRVGPTTSMKLTLIQGCW